MKFLIQFAKIVGYFYQKPFIFFTLDVGGEGIADK